MEGGRGADAEEASAVAAAEEGEDKEEEEVDKEEEEEEMGKRAGGSRARIAGIQASQTSGGLLFWCSRTRRKEQKTQRK